MFASLIPILALFLFACIIMLVGQRLQPKKSVSEDPQELDVFSRRARSTRTARARLYNGQGVVSSYAGPVGEVRGKMPLRLPFPLVLILLFGLCLVLLVQTSFRGGAALPISLVNAPAQPTQGAIAQSTPAIQTPSGVSSASKNVHHIAQMDRSQYDSDAEYNTWAASACSAVSMTVVINAYGHNYRVTDILKVEIAQHAIDPDLGLLEPAGINRTADKLGFRTLQMNKAPLNSLIAVANNGWPIIVGFPPGKHWPGGHILVVTGGDDTNVFLADSAPSNLPSVSHDRFMQDWGGMALIIMPKDR